MNQGSLTRALRPLPRVQTHVLAHTAALANFTSLVPHRRDALTAPALWLTHAEMLLAGGGGRKEHAHLLAGLLAHAGINAYVVAGCGVDGTSTAAPTVCTPPCMLPAGAFDNATMHTPCQVLPHVQLRGASSVRDCAGPHRANLPWLFAWRPRVSHHPLSEL